MKALVTGASGFVGYWVARKLMEKGVEVKVLLRDKGPRHLEELHLEVAKGDLRDKESLKNALLGCDRLFHVAAHYKLWEKDPKIFYDINVEGTRHLLSLAGELGVEKIVYTSSVAAIKIAPEGESATEQSIAQPEDIVGHYKKSKYFAEKVAMDLAAQGVPIVVVNPSAPVGAYDVKPTPTGKIILDFLQGKMPAYLHTGLNLVSVEDVATGHLLAAEKGEIGHRYILGNQNLYLIDILRILASISGRKAPKIKLPYWVAYLAGATSDLVAKTTGKESAIPLDGVRMAKKLMFFDSSLAREALGYRTTPIEEALEKAVRWFQENNYV